MQHFPVNMTHVTRSHTHNVKLYLKLWMTVDIRSTHHCLISWIGSYILELDVEGINKFVRVGKGKPHL